MLLFYSSVEAFAKVRDRGRDEGDELVKEACAVDAGLACGAGEIVEVGTGGGAVVLTFAKAEPVVLVRGPGVVGCAGVEATFGSWVDHGEGLDCIWAERDACAYLCEGWCGC